MLRIWQKRGLTACLLWPLSLIFGLISGLRRQAFQRGWLTVQTLPVPVIVVGNLTVGGTGKTPTVIALVEALRAAGYTPGVISRGYGVDAKTPRRVTPQSLAAQSGDEPVLIAQRTQAPMWICSDRPAAGRALCAAHPDVDVIISDDGLQHYRLARQVELVVFDHRLGGNGFLLPAGPLREPLSRRRDATLVNHGDASGTAALPRWPNTYPLDLEADLAWQLTAPEQRRPLSSFKEHNILAAAGIGAPERFFALLRRAGLHPTTLPLPDHYAYRDNPFAASHAEIILMTEKDAVKCSGWNDARVWVVPVRAVLASKLVEIVVEKMRGSPFA